MTTVSGVRGSRILSVFLLLFLAAAPLIAHASPRGDEPFADPLSGQGNGSAKSTPAVPHEYDLAQNFPNPFNPSTVIQYAIPVKSHVILTVHNLLGQVVATIVNGEQEAGFHEIRFDAVSLASGVYLYRLEAGKYVQTRKLTLIR
jgi:hypothetical protein